MPDHNQDPFGSISITDNSPDLKDKRADQDTPREKIGPQKRKLPPPKTHLRKWFSALGIILTIYLTSGFFLVPHLLENTLPTIISDRMKRQVVVGNSSFNPINLKLSLTNSIIGPRIDQPQDPVDPLCAIINLEGQLSWLSLLSGKPLITRLTIDQGFVHLVRRPDKTYNLPIIDQLLSLAPDNPAPLAGFSPKLRISNIHLKDSRILVDDQVTGQQHRLEDIQLTLPALNQFQTDNKLAPHLSALFNNSPINLTGTTTVSKDSLQSRFQLKFDQINLPTYLAYLDKEKTMTLEKGLANASMELIYTTSTNEPSRLRIKCTGKALNLKLRSQNNIIKLPLVDFSGSFTPFTNKYHFHSLEIIEPDLSVNRDKSGEWQYPFLLNSLLTTNSYKNKLVIDSLKVHRGRLAFLDQKIPGGFAKNFADIELALESFNSRQQKSAPFLITATSNKGKERFKGQGEISSKPANLKGRLSVSRFNLADFTPYVTMAEKIYLQKGIISGLETGFTITNGEQPRLILQNVTADLNSMTLINNQEKWLTIPGGAVRAEHLSTDGKITLKQLNLTSPVIHLVRKKDKKINWPQITGQTSKPWQFSLDSLLVENGTIILQDDFPAKSESQSLTRVRLEASHINLNNNQPGRLSLQARVNEKGRISLSGPFSLKPISGEFNATVSDLELADLPQEFNPWLPRELTKATLSATGVVKVPEQSFQGKLNLLGLNCQSHIGQPIFQARKIHTPDINLRIEPPSLTAASLEITQPSLTLSINNGRINKPALQFNNQLFYPAKDFFFKNINIIDGSVSLDNQQLSPPLATKFNLEGVIIDAGNQPENKTSFSLQGTGPEESRISINGKALLFANEPSVNLELNLTKQNLLPLAPYFTAVTGHKLSKGNISVSTNYHRHDKKISSNTHLITQNLAAEPSLTGNNLPLPLALALLSDNNNKVEISIPVKGATHSPSFSYSKTMAREIRNIILKAAVSQVTILKESLNQTNVPDHLQFPPGEAGITAANKTTLTDLAQILVKRPGLHLKISGFADPDYDGRAMLTLKRKEMEKKKIAYEQLRSNLLAEHYGSEVIAPITGSEPVTSWQKNDDMMISENELNRLAHKRCQNVMNYLRDKLKIKAERLFCQTINPNNKLGRQNNRCDFLYTVPDNKQD